MEFRSEVTAYLQAFTYEEESGNYSLFSADDNATKIETILIDGNHVAKYVNEFWTSKQRQASSIHEISYRACFKPQLPRFFVELLSAVGDIIYDPFSGRGTTVIEAGLLGRKIVSNDVSPLSAILTRPRFTPPTVEDVAERLSTLNFDNTLESEMDLGMFFHEKTLSEILSIRKYLCERKESGDEDDLDRWIAMVATNRLTGHSTGFFSVYTLPPNQAVSPESQKKINEVRGQTPEYRDTKEIILRKTKTLLRNLTSAQKANLKFAGMSALFTNQSAANTQEIPSDSVQLTVTSPPFLNIVQYSKDNWLRCWFNCLDGDEISKRITMAKTVEEWSTVMGRVFHELYRITKPNGWVAFEVGEVKNRTVNLDEHVVPLGNSAGFECNGILVNFQEFTKTANIWGIRNMKSGTNTNRIVLFRKPK
ncbi:MAG: DNA methyltransferase [Lentisphaerae bacterium]|nr:DNA methyltransferase [Lentisphaerota bacterium]